MTMEMNYKVHPLNLHILIAKLYHHNKGRSKNENMLTSKCPSFQPLRILLLVRIQEAQKILRISDVECSSLFWIH